MADNDKKEKNEPSIVVMLNIIFAALMLVQVIWPKQAELNQHNLDMANLQVCQSNLEELHKACDYYRNKYHRFPANINELVGHEEGLLAEMPRCPAGEKPTYVQKGFLTQPGDPGRYTICCTGTVHSGIEGFKMNEPYYDSFYGIRPRVTF